MHFTQTQTIRPTMREALEEATLSPDDHWTANLSKIGMTRIARRTVLTAYLYSVEDLI